MNAELKIRIEDITIEQFKESYIYYVKTKRLRDKKLEFTYNQFIEFCRENNKFFDFYVLKREI